MQEVYKSRITHENLTIGNNTHEIVINRLIELWNTEPLKCIVLFNDIAERLAKYDNPTFPKVRYDKTNNNFSFSITRNGKHIKVATNKNYEIVAEKRRKYIQYNK